jgi:PAS domain-containing protein
LITQNGRLQYANRGAIELLGCSVEILTPKLELATKFIHPEDREMVFDRYFERENEAVPLHYPFRYPFRIVAQDGTVKNM